MRDADVGEQRVNVRVAAEKRVQARFEPIAVAVAPRREFAAGNIALLENEGRFAGIRKIFCRR
jgi:hypothetical protein